jgi:hypothetical protein
MSSSDELRGRIAAILAPGVADIEEDFPFDDPAFVRILAALKMVPKNDLERRLAIAGFCDRPVVAGGSSMRCQECIYYLPHRRWCDLPELALPVEPDWYCRLWKV